MNKMKVIVTVCAAAMSFGVSAVPLVSGIQTNVSEASFLAAGWVEVSAVSTAQYGNIAASLAGVGLNDYIAVGVRDNNTGLFVTVAETTRASFQTYTPFNTTHDDNGVSWYYNAYSVGFTELGNAISQNQADVNLSNQGNQGMSWHALVGGPGGVFDFNQSPDTYYPGWGANNGSFVFTWSDQYSRVILSGDSNNVPEPASMALIGLGLAGLGFSCRRKA